MPTKSTTTKTTTKEEAPMPTTTKPKPKPQAKSASTTHPLAHFVPDKMYYDSYVPRVLHGDVPDMTVMEEAAKNGMNVLLYGPTGAAKTSFIYAFAALKGLPVVNVACQGGIDYEQLIGGWKPKSTGGFHFVAGELVLAAMHGGVVLLNEVNFMPPKIAAIIYGLLDRRRTIYLPDAVGSDFPTTVTAHPDFFVVADYNPGYAGTRPLNAAFKNRFAVKLPWGYDHDVEATLLNSPVLLEMAEALRTRAEAGDFITPITTNMLIELEAMIYNDSLGYYFAVENFVAAFEYDEQAAVREVFAVNRDRIWQDFGMTIPADDDQ